MKQESKQQSREQEQLAAGSSGQITTEFASTEELLRHDAAQTEVPPAVAERLSKSIENLPRPSRSWWQRIFNR